MTSVNSTKFLHVNSNVFIDLKLTFNHKFLAISTFYDNYSTNYTLLSSAKILIYDMQYLKNYKYIIPSMKGKLIASTAWYSDNANLYVIYQDSF